MLSRRGRHAWHESMSFGEAAPRREVDASHVPGRCPSRLFSGIGTYLVSARGYVLPLRTFAPDAAWHWGGRGMGAGLSRRRPSRPRPSCPSCVASPCLSHPSLPRPRTRPRTLHPRMLHPRMRTANAALCGESHSAALCEGLLAWTTAAAPNLLSSAPRLPRRAPRYLVLDSRYRGRFR